MTRTASSPHIVTLKLAIAGAILLFAAMIGASFTFSQRVSAASFPAPVKVVADAADNCGRGSGFFGLEPWYHFMPNELGVPQEVSNGKVTVVSQPCGVRCFNILVQNTPNECGETQSDIPGVILAVVDDLLRISGLVAVAFIIYGSFEFVGSRGNSERTAKAQSTIISALTGLAVALVAVGLVSFIGNKLQ